MFEDSLMRGDFTGLGLEGESSHELAIKATGYIHDFRLTLARLLQISGIEQNPGMMDKRSMKNKRAGIKKGGKSQVERFSNKEKFNKGEDKPLVVEVNARKSRQFDLNVDLEELINKKNNNNKIHRHNIRNLPFTKEALARLSHTSEEDAKFQILKGKYLAQRAACQRVRTRLRNLISSGRVTTLAAKSELRQRLKSIVPIHSQDVNDFLNKGTLRVAKDALPGKLALLYISHNIISIFDAVNFITQHHATLGISIPEDLNRAFGDTHNFRESAVDPRFLPFLVKTAPSWVRPMLMSPSILIRYIMPTLIVTGKQIGRAHV